MVYFLSKEDDHMDPITVGKQIAEHRKRLGLTQKELAELLHITDGAVSKWERGINYPDFSLLEPLAAALDTSPLHLLSLESATKYEIADVMTDISLVEQKKLVKEFKQRAFLNIALGLILITCLLTASIIFKNHNIYGLAHGVTLGAIGFVGTMIGSDIFYIRNINKLHH